MDKKTEQINGKITPELKKQIHEFCEKHNIHESEFINLVAIHYFNDYYQRGPVKMHMTAIGAA